MIVRRRDYEKKAPKRDAHKIYVVCEGSVSEPNYFNFFRGLSSNIEIIPIPSFEGKTDPIKLKEYAEAFLIGNERRYELDYRQGDTIYFVIDTDTWEQEGKIQILRNFCDEQNCAIKWAGQERPMYKAWGVVQSNPCFEIWLYYHTYDQKPTDNIVNEFSSFKEFVSLSYAGGFDYESDPVRISDAIKNSKHNFGNTSAKVGKYTTEMHMLAEEIYSFVKEDIRRLRNKLIKA